VGPAPLDVVLNEAGFTGTTIQAVAGGDDLFPDGCKYDHDNGGYDDWSQSEPVVVGVADGKPIVMGTPLVSQVISRLPPSVRQFADCLRVVSASTEVLPPLSRRSAWRCVAVLLVCLLRCRLRVSQWSSTSRLVEADFRRTAGFAMQSAELHLAANRTDQALKAWRHALRLDPLKVPVLLKLGETLCSVQQHKEGLRYLMRAAVVAPGLPAVHVFLGKGLSASGQHFRASRAFSRAVDLSGNLVPALRGQAVALWHLGQFKQAEKSLLDELQLNPAGDAAALVEALRRGDSPPQSGGVSTSASLEVWTQTHDLDKDWKQWFEQGLAKQSQMQVDDAIHCFERAREIFPSSALVHYHLGVLHMSKYWEMEHFLHASAKDRMHTALGAFTDAVYMDPLFPAAHHHLCVVSDFLGDTELALEHCEHAFRLDPAVGGTERLVNSLASRVESQRRRSESLVVAIDNLVARLDPTDIVLQEILSQRIVGNRTHMAVRDLYTPLIAIRNAVAAWSRTTNRDVIEGCNTVFADFADYSLLYFANIGLFLQDAMPEAWGALVSARAEISSMCEMKDPEEFVARQE